MRLEPIDDRRELAEDAAEWLSIVENGSVEDRGLFVTWLKRSPKHVEEVLQMMELDAALSILMPQKLGAHLDPRQYAIRACPTPCETNDWHGLPAEQVNTYRRAIIQILIQRRIDYDSAEDLFQELWLQVLEDSHVETLTDPTRLSDYLYRAACERVVAMRRGEPSWVGGHRPTKTGMWQPDEVSALEEDLGARQLGRCARNLLFRAPPSPDRRVLEYFFLRPEPGAEARRRLKLSEDDLCQALWRVRQLFGDIVREHGITLNDPETLPLNEVANAALYVANALPSKAKECAFELRMMWNSHCAAEVDVWRALKRGLIQVERPREKVAC